MINYFPIWCYICHQHIDQDNRSVSRFICMSCYEQLPFISQNICGKCGDYHNTEGCKSEWAQLINRFYSIFKYEDPIHQWIVSLKYSKNILAGRVLRGFVNQWFMDNQEVLASIELLIPVPIHPFRLIKRGFNQTSFLLATQKVLPVKKPVVRKTRFTRHQAGLSREKRIQNLKNSFKAKRSLENKTVLIFDDVCTTGQTLSEICHAIKNAGAADIHVLTLCRTLG